MNDFKFQLCKRGKKFPTGPDWCFQPKINGIRYAVEICKGTIRAFGRHSELAIPDHLYEAFAGLFGFALNENRIFDGEFKYGPDDHSSWGVIGRDRPPPVGAFYVFDILKGQNDKRLLRERLMDVSWLPESEALSRVVGYRGDKENAASWAYEKFLSDGYEGMVAKRLDQPYTPGRHDIWLKFKP